MDATEIMSPETAVTGLIYWDTTEGASSRLEWAPWVNRKTSAIAGASRDGIWGERIALINKRLGLADLDRIADETGGVREVSRVSCGGRGGRLTLVGVLAAVELAAERESAPKAPHAGPAIMECLECGATYPAEKAHLIDAGGMGCARCNH